MSALKTQIKIFELRLAFNFIYLGRSEHLVHDDAVLCGVVMRDQQRLFRFRTEITGTVFGERMGKTRELQ